MREYFRAKLASAVRLTLLLPAVSRLERPHVSRRSRARSHATRRVPARALAALDGGESRPRREYCRHARKVWRPSRRLSLESTARRVARAGGAANAYLDARAVAADAWLPERAPPPLAPTAPASPRGWLRTTIDASMMPRPRGTYADCASRRAHPARGRRWANPGRRSPQRRAVRLAPRRRARRDACRDVGRAFFFHRGRAVCAVLCGVATLAVPKLAAVRARARRRRGPPPARARSAAANRRARAPRRGRRRPAR